MATATRRLTLLGLCGLLLSLAGAGCDDLRAGVVRVTLTVPTPERVDMRGIRRVLVTSLVVDEEAPDLDLNREVVVLLRSQLRKLSALDILRDEPPPLPEQPLQELMANTGFWRRLADRHGADLVITGKAGFLVEDRSGFAERDEISPLTGQRVRRTRFIDREAFTLDLNLFFVRGSTGQLLYEDHLVGENTFNGRGHDSLSSLFSLFEQLEDDIAGIIAPRAATVQRNLFTD